MRQTHKLEGVPFVLIALNSDRQDETEIFKAHGFTNIVKCQGVWNNQPEDSYAVFFTSPTQLQSLIQIGREYNQEAILVVDSNRDAKLMELENCNQTNVGPFRAITKAEALLSGAFTYVPNMDTYFKAC